MKKRGSGLLIIAIPVTAKPAPKSMRAMTKDVIKKTPKRAKAR